MKFQHSKEPEPNVRPQINFTNNHANHRRDSLFGFFSVRRRILSTTASIFLVGLAAPAKADSVSWIGESGNWNDVVNWSTGAVPGEQDDVIIDRPGVDVVVTHWTGPSEVKSLRSEEELVLVGGTLTVTTTMRVGGKLRLASVGTLKRATLTTTGGGQVTAESGGILDGVTLATEVGGGGLTIAGGLTLSGGAKLASTAGFGLYIAGGTQTLGGNGEIVFEEGGRIFLGYGGEGTVTVGPQVTVLGPGQIFESSPASLINEGTFLVDGAARTLTLRPTVFTNRGTMRATGGAHLDIRPGHWTQDGTIIVGAASSASLGGAWTNEGTIIPAPDATVNLIGTLNGGLAAQSGTWRLGNSGRVKGGTVTAADGARIIAEGGALEGVILATKVGYSDLYLAKGLTFSGDSALASIVSNSRIRTESGLQRIDGRGEIVLAGGQLLIGTTGESQLTLGPQVTVRGYGAIYAGSSPATLINEGLIHCEGQQANQTFHMFEPLGFINHGILRAGSPGGFQIQIADALSDGPVEVLSGCGLRFDGQLRFDDPAALSMQPGAELWVRKNLLGTTRQTGAQRLDGMIYFQGLTTPAAPSLLEVMSRDRGPVNDGFLNNFAMGTLYVDNNSAVKLVDEADNAEGTGLEAVYVDSLIVRSGATLELNGLKVFTRLSRIDGAVVGGGITLLPDGGALPFDRPSPGAFSNLGEVDEWTFFGRPGQRVTIEVETNVTSAPVNFAHIILQDPQLNVLADRSNSASGEPASLRGIDLPANGLYRIRIDGPPGSYRVAVWNVAVESLPLVLNQRHEGHLAHPLSNDRWTFTAEAGRQVRFDLAGLTYAGSIVFSLTGPGGWIGFENLTGSSGLITLPGTGSYALSARSAHDRVYNVSYAFRLTETAQTSLALGTPHTAALAGPGHAQLFRIEVTESGPLSFFLRNAELGNRLEIYANRGVPPTREFSEFNDISGSAASRELLIPAAAGSWYILVYADTVAVPGTFSIEARQSPIVLTEVTPGSQAGNVGATLALTGAGFSPGVTAELVSSGGTVFPLAGVSVDTFTRMTAAVPAGSVPAGTYGLRVRRPGGASSTLPNAFTVLSPGAPQFETRLIMPEFLGRHAAVAIYVEYANTGNASMPAPLLILQSGDPDGSDRPILDLNPTNRVPSFWFGPKKMPPGASSEILLLASGAQPGLLHPGERIQVPVYYTGLLLPWDFSDFQVELELRFWAPDDPTPIDWAGRKESLRPPTLDAATWDVVYANLTSGLATTADFTRMLSDNVQFLGRLGLKVVDVDELWNFEVRQACGFSARTTLDEVTDATVAAPGIGLSLTRRFSSDLRSRQMSGLFGRGWFTPWQDQLVIESDGDVVRLVGEAGSARVFSRDTRSNGYFSRPDDNGTLVFSGGIYQLYDPDGTVTRFRPDGRIDSVQDTNGNLVTAAWNGSGRLTGLTHSEGGSISLTYNGDGVVGSVSDSAGRSVTYSYTGPYLTSTTTDDGKVSGYTYATAGTQFQRHALTSVTRSGVTRHFTWDAGGRLGSTSLAGGEEMATFGYDSAGAVTVTTGGGTTSLFFEHRGLLAKITDPLGNITTGEFDAGFRLRRLVLPSGDGRSFTWHGFGSPASINDELGHLTRFSYDHPWKQLTQFTDAKGNSTQYGYDAKGNLLDTAYADGSVGRLGSYTANGLPRTWRNRRSQAVNLTYTLAGQVDRKTFTDGSYHDSDYDSRGNPVKVTGHPATGPDKVTTLAYNPASDGDRLKKVTWPDGRWVEYFHDIHGRRSRMTDSAGGDTRYEFDAASRLWKVRDAADAVLAEYLYDSAGRLLRFNKGNGTYTIWDYDVAGRIRSLTNHAANGAANSRFEYTYDVRGFRTGLATQNGQWTYTYDVSGQLTRAVFTSTNPLITSQDLRYQYDALGNRIATVLNGTTTTYTPGALNQYTSVGGAARQYDADGNLISDGERTYEYNVENRLVQVTGPEGVTRYEYDVFGHRTATVLNGARTEYLVDPTGSVDVVADFKNGAVTARNTQALGLAARHLEGGERLYFDIDPLGSVVAATNQGGAVLGTWAYLPFGGKLATGGTVPDNPFQLAGFFGIGSEANGLEFMRARFYSPRDGKFLNDDPLGLGGGDQNLSRYVRNNPVSFIDISGEEPVEPEGLGGILDALGERAEAINQMTLKNLGVSARRESEARAKIARQTDSAAREVGGGISHRGKPGVFAAITPFRLIYDAAQAGRRYDPASPGSNARGGGPGNSSGSGSSGVAFAVDPNEKIGPVGYGPQAWIPADALMPYRINFENLGPGSKKPNGDPYPNVATAPAQRVTITDPLSASLDWSTFRFTEFGFGDTIVPVPSGSGGSSHFTGSVPLTYNGKTFDVEITAGINFSTGLVSVRLQSIDPETSLPPDVLTGFLPPEDGTGRGKGHISFTVRSRADLPTGTAIRNVAQIRFDVNEVITTDQVNPQDPAQGTDPEKRALVTLDKDPPASTIGTLPGTTSSPVFQVTWSGTDTGAGLARYDIYVSDNGGAWALWQAFPAGTTSALFTGQVGHTYGFRSVARDHAGNVQTTPALAQATTTAGSIPVPELNIGAVRMPDGTTVQVTLTYDVLAGYTYTVEASDTLGANPVWQPLPGAPHQTGTVIDTPTVPRRFYRLRRQ